MNEQGNSQAQGQGATAVAPLAPQTAAPQTQTLPLPGPAAPNLRRLFLINGLGFLVVLLIALAIFYIWHQGYYFYSTDDAVVTGNIINVAAPSPGTIVTANYGLGQTVSAGSTVATLRMANGTVVAVTSPINGTIINEGATPGEVLPAGQPIAQVVDLSRLIITA
jgi:multidrug resistance efflux pump